mmetsp:Transcript_5502/g.11916  ORF Transcript_5502/g.11916 Transcript_5502/m.11916 type:complete len:129 (-) Transcript_5502:277-663(-)
MFVLPLVNFYNFMMLASRVIRVKFHYCDDYITEDCMVTSTWHWECMMRLLMLIGFTVVTMHLSLPMPKVKKSEAEAKEETEWERVLSRLERLVILRGKGALTPAEFEQQKAMLFPKSRFESPRAGCLI